MSSEIPDASLRDADLVQWALVVEDHPETQRWLADVVRRAFQDIEVEVASSLRQANRLLDASDAPPRIALIDLGLPDGSGIELVRRIATEWPNTFPVVTTIYDDDVHLFDSIAAGARGYVLKYDEPEAVLRCLQRIDKGEPPLSPSIARRILDRLRPAAPYSSKDEAGLTARETEVLTLLARGLTVNEAAATLGLKPQTVAGYVKILYQKLGVTNRAGATLAAAHRGLT